MTARSISSFSPLVVTGALALVLAMACATGPNPAVTDARRAYDSAAADPVVADKAAVALRDAEQAVDSAERADHQGEDRVEVDHLAYVASRRVEIARAIAAKRLAQERAQALADSQNAVLLDARTRELDALAQELQDLKARETERGLVLTVGDVLFDVDRAELKPEATAPLALLAGFLREHPDRVVEVEGHTDSTGSSAYNMQLSQARADAVRTALIAAGVNSARIEARGFGETAPVASNATSVGRLQNRRVEIIVPPMPIRTGSVR